MPIKKIITNHFFPFVIGVIALFFLKDIINRYQLEKYPLQIQSINELKSTDHFYINDLTQQLAFSYSLTKGIPVLIGSSELTSSHLKGLAQNYFTGKNQKIFCFGHAGFQSLAILTVLAANKALLKNSKIIINISPGWFEKQYAGGTSLTSFLEYCTPNYLFQLLKDSTLDGFTKAYIFNFINKEYEKINSPDVLLRLAAKTNHLIPANYLNAPFNYLNKKVLAWRIKNEFYISSQNFIVQKMQNDNYPNYLFKCQSENWDSLFNASQKAFELISTSNSLAVENNYYYHWLKNKKKKHLIAVEENNNVELKDFNALLQFLKINNCSPLFVLMPLNTKAHENAEVLEPTLKIVLGMLKANNLKTLDMFSPNLKTYQNGVLEDLMHPYDYGWYQIDKFISDNYCLKNE